jgi:hypothetical protein
MNFRNNLTAFSWKALQQTAAAMLVSERSYLTAAAAVAELQR